MWLDSALEVLGVFAKVRGRERAAHISLRARTRRVAGDPLRLSALSELRRQMHPAAAFAEECLIRAVRRKTCE